MSPTSWPPRTAICVACRTALPPGVPCPAHHGRPVSLADGERGREALLTAVWGPPPVRQKLRDMARAGATSGGIGGLFDGCSGCDIIGGDLGEILMAIVIFIAIGVLLWCLVTAVSALVRRWRGRQRPRGAALPGQPCLPTGRTGTVVARAGLQRDPLTGSPCVGFAAALEHRSSWWRRPVTMLRDGATVGFDILLDTGERVSVPPGPMVVDLGAARAARVDRMLLALYLGELDPARDTVDDLDPFLCNLMRAAQLRPGDRVELFGAVTARPLVGAAPAGYREPAPSFLVPTGVPHLRCVPV
ncbi:MAG TPA: hypothetical protein VIG06_13735 [Kofleriaceae bacterium]|jgi:hypothetical protein